MTDDYHFTDDRLMYQFRVDYKRRCLLSDVLHEPRSFLAADVQTNTTRPPGVSRQGQSLLQADFKESPLFKGYPVPLN